MIIHKSHIMDVKVKMEEEGVPCIYGTMSEFHFAHLMDGDNRGVCGVNCVILALYRDSEKPEGDKFYVDIGIEAHIPEFYTVLPKVIVTSVIVTDKDGKERNVLVEYENVDFIRDTINGVNTTKPKLTLVRSYKDLGV